MVETKLVTQPRGGGEYLEEIPAEIMTYGERLNLPGSIQFKLAAAHSTATEATLNPGVHEIVVERDGAPVWAGPLLTMTEPEKPESGGWLFDFAGEGLLHYPWRWYVTSTLTFTATDQFTIAKALVDFHQNKAGGDFGIDTSGVGLSGVVRDRTYYGYEQKNIGEALQQLAEVRNGFDYSIDPASRALRLHYPKKGARKTDLVWDERNIRRFVRSRDSTAQASQELGIGLGEGDRALRAATQDAAAVATFGLTQHTYSNAGIGKMTTLVAHIERELALFKNPAEMIAVVVGTEEPPVFSYEVGDEGRVVWPSTYAPVNRFMRLVGRDITWEAGEERAVLYLEAVV